MLCITTHPLSYFFCLASVASPLDSLIAPAKETYPVVLCYITIVNLFIQISCCVISTTDTSYVKLVARGTQQHPMTADSHLRRPYPWYGSLYHALSLSPPFLFLAL